MCAGTAWTGRPKRGRSLVAVWRSRLEDLEGAYAWSTICSYRFDFGQFETWCRENDQACLPAAPETVADYIQAISGTLSPSTVQRRMTGVGRIHRVMDEDDPTRTEVVRLAVRRLMRTHGRRPKQVLGLRADLRDQMVGATDDDLLGLRDRVLISLGYDTLCRRSELVELRLEDISAPEEDGSATILVRRSKTDQEGRGRLAYVSPRTLKAISEFRRAAGLSEGYVLRRINARGAHGGHIHPSTIATTIKRLAEKANLDPDTIARLSGHSFRVGAALDMTESGIDLVPIMHAGGWKSPSMVTRYTQQIDTMRAGMARLYQKRER